MSFLPTCVRRPYTVLAAFVIQCAFLILLIWWISGISTFAHVTVSGTNVVRLHSDQATCNYRRSKRFAMTSSTNSPFSNADDVSTNNSVTQVIGNAGTTLEPALKADILSEQHCVETFLTLYESTCIGKMRPNKANEIPEVKDSSNSVTNVPLDKHEDNQLCPCVPDGLCGFVDMHEELTDDNSNDDSSVLNDNESQTFEAPAGGVLLNGGRWAPGWCIARQRVAVVIPFRNRHRHLDIFLRHIRPVLQRQLLDFTIFVVEQVSPDLFNRGSLLNVGYKEAKARAQFDCYVFHDVDMLPLDDRNFYTCSQVSPKHIAGFQKNRNYRLTYDCYFGGITAFTSDQFSLVNGYSNTFSGWGGEDDDLLRRVWAQKMNVAERFPKCVSRIGMIQHKREPVGIHQPLGLLWRPELYRVDGLNSLKYELQSYEERASYTLIRVKLPTPETESSLSQHHAPFASSPWMMFINRGKRPSSLVEKILRKTSTSAALVVDPRTCSINGSHVPTRRQ